MSNDKMSQKSTAIDNDLKLLSQQAKNAGIGNNEFSSLNKIVVNVQPSPICRAYAHQLHDAMYTTLVLETGHNEVTLGFSEGDLYVYLTLMISARIQNVNRERVPFTPKDERIKIPHFFYTMLHQLGEVTDETRHVWLTLKFDETEIKLIRNQWDAVEAITDEKARKEAREEWREEYAIYSGRGSENDFIYDMARRLTMLERYGFVNGSGLPRGLTGSLDFMLFTWAEDRLMHAFGNVEPGQGVLASLLAFNRALTILNPYISYGRANAYHVLLKELTLPRNANSFLH